MKLKTLAVITLLVLGCSAAFAQGSATLGFLDYSGTFLYCNYETFQYGGANNFYFQGVDNLTAACFAPIDATIEGVRTPVNSLDGSPVTGNKVYAYADNVIDAQYEAFTGEQWFVLTQIKPSVLLHHYGWVGYIGVEGYEFFGNYGYLSADIPGKSSKPVSSKSTISAAHTASRANLTKMVTK